MYYRIYAQRIFSERWLEQVDFYESAIGLEKSFFDEQLGFAMFTLDTAYLAIEKTSSENYPHLIGRYVGLTLQVKNLNDAYDRLARRGVEFTLQPDRQLWGGLMAEFRDLEGNVISLLEV